VCPQDIKRISTLPFCEGIKQTLKNIFIADKADRVKIKGAMTWPIQNSWQKSWHKKPSTLPERDRTNIQHELFI